MKNPAYSAVLLILPAVLCAAPEKVASIRLGGTEKIIAAVGKIGSFTGNETLGAMFSGSLMQSEAIQYFGPTRTGANIFFQIGVDAAKTNDRVSVSVLYPVVAKKAKFLKHHAGAVEKDGVVIMPKDSDGDATYVIFSADGKWAALADTPECAKATLGAVAEAERPLGSSLLEIDVASGGMKGLCALAEATRKAGTDAADRIDRASLDVLQAMDYLTIGVKVTDAGIDMTASVQAKPGTELSKTGLSPYDEKLFATLGKDVFLASAVGRDSMMPCQKGWKDLLAFLRTHGLKPDFVTREEKPGLVRLTLDPVAMVAYLSSAATNDLKKVDLEKIAADFQAFAQDQNDRPFSAKGDAVTGAFAIKGLAGSYTPAERLSATLPELAGKKPFYVQCGSVYAVLHALLPSLMKLAGEETAATLTPMLTVLAPEDAAGVAWAAWRDGDAHRAVLRVSAAEIKGFASCFALMAAYSSATAGQDGDEDDTSADESDDDED